ncbi:putative vacuolar membrane transporter for cationic amino acids [Coemansia helicoidea]|uniref:Vacuolar membrane transporter for cationic amino acids n=1 Tax=Coemansia helicoidea TaxID=1286919 RepID=A0ACC1LBW1_9FUNG|nr:putative vacuolar membrane transporter for cationic amino acids [Coemansia helicoidea]
MESEHVWLSAAIGYLSLACWMVVMFPQIVLNYRRRSGEGVSLAMMVAWVVGDVLNIAGALMQGLVMSTVLIASYFLLVDSTLLGQIFYYRVVYAAHRAPKTPAAPADADADADARPAAAAAAARRATRLQTALAVVLSLLSVALLVAMVAALAGAPAAGDGPETDPKLPASQLLAQAMGTVSAVVYIMSYVPQAIQNYQRQSCDGLSMWLFLLSLLGNTTYALAILVVSLDPEYLAPYVPWLLGALVPCLIHVVILYQFYVY